MDNKLFDRVSNQDLMEDLVYLEESSEYWLKRYKLMKEPPKRFTEGFSVRDTCIKILNLFDYAISVGATKDIKIQLFDIRDNLIQIQETTAVEKKDPPTIEKVDNCY